MAGNLEELPLPDELPVIPDGWRYESLGNLVEDRGVSYGIVQPGSETTDGVPVVRVNNIRNGRIDTTEMLKVGTDVEAKFLRSRLSGGEVLLTLVGTLGEVAIVPDNLRGWNVARAVGVIPVREDPGSLWVSICLRSAFIQHCIRTWATTTVQATFNLRDLAKLPIPIPPTDTRKAIAAVLGALDDKIELNRRMNATLEAMARALFQSWFVDFDPVRAKLDGRKPIGLDDVTATLFPDSFQDSPVGHVPKGWEVGRLDDVLTLQRGFDLPTPDRTHGVYPVMAASGSNGCHDKFMVRGPGVTTGRSGVLGRVFFIHGDFWPLNTSLWVKEFKRVSPSYAFHLLRGLDFEMFNAGSAVPTLNRNHVHNLPVVMPPKPVVEAFDVQVMPLMQQQKANQDQSSTLATLRDALLPKLLSGQLRVAT
jgi:type I restriction enzyme, S subunit